MRIVFMGTPEFAATILESLTEEHEVVGVYTRPDAVRGRGNSLEASPVKEVALTNGLDVYTPFSLRDAGVQGALATLEPDMICVAAYGAILPVEVLKIPRYECLNVHASLLPRWRGAAPIERAILAGDQFSGVCIMRMEEGLDTGPYCVCRSVGIEDKNAETLSNELAHEGAAALKEAIGQIEQGTVHWTEQDESFVTYAHKIEKHELDLQLSDTAEQLARKVQASSSAHPARVRVAKRMLTILQARSYVYNDIASVLGDASLLAGEVRFIAKRLFFGTADGVFEVLRVKPDGKNTMDAKSFAAGVHGIKQGGITWEAPCA